MKSDEFWDYEKQVDLEAFSCNEFYSILSKQSRDVTSSIARQKDQVCYFSACITGFKNSNKPKIENFYDRLNLKMLQNE